MPDTTSTNTFDPLSYSTYTTNRQTAINNSGAAGGGGDGGGPSFTPTSLIDETTWNTMSPYARYSAIESGSGGYAADQLGQYGVKPSQATIDAYTQQFGGAPPTDLQVQYLEPGQQYVQGWGPQSFIDPSKIYRNPDGTIAFDASNVNADWYKQYINADAHSGLDLNPLKGVATILSLGTIGDLALGADAIGGAATAGGADATIDTSLLPNVTAPETLSMVDANIPELTVPGAAGAGAAGGAPLTQLASNAGVTDVPIGELGPAATTSGLDTSALPNVTAPETLTMDTLPELTVPGATPPGASTFDWASNAPIESGIPPPTMQPAPPIEQVTPPDFNVDQPGIGQTLLDSVTRNPLAAGGLALNVASQIHAARNSSANQIRDAVKPISDEAASLLAQYGKGQLNAADEFRINQWEQAAIAKAQSLYGGNQTASLNAVNNIKQQAQAMRDQALQGLLKEGLAASGMAVGPLIQAIEEESRTDTAFAQAQAGALTALTRLAAGNATNVPTAPTGGTPSG